MALPCCIFYLLNSQYISHVYAGNNKRIHISKFISFMLYNEGKKVDLFNGDFSGFKLIHSTHQIEIILGTFSIFTMPKWLSYINIITCLEKKKSIIQVTSDNFCFDWMLLEKITRTLHLFFERHFGCVIINFVFCLTLVQLI